MRGISGRVMQEQGARTTAGEIHNSACQCEQVGRWEVTTSVQGQGCITVFAFMQPPKHPCVYPPSMYLSTILPLPNHSSTERVSSQLDSKPGFTVATESSGSYGW